MCSRMPPSDGPPPASPVGSRHDRPCVREQSAPSAPFASASSTGVPTATTMMLRNVPRMYTQHALLCELEIITPPGSIDMLYLPYERSGTSNLGYAFVNFVRPNFAEHVRATMEGGTWKVHSSTKKAKVTPAYVQGLRGNILQCANRLEREDVSNDPLLFVNGEQVDFRSFVRDHLQYLGLGEGRLATSCGSTEAASWSSAGRGAAPPRSLIVDAATTAEAAATWQRPVRLHARFTPPFDVHVSVLRDIREIFDVFESGPA